MSELPRIRDLQDATEITASDVAPPIRTSTFRRNFVKKGILALALLTGASAAAYYGHDYITRGRYLETTDDAYVKTDSTIVAPKVAGYIDDVLVRDNEHVTAGQVLARIDDRDFRAALAQAQAGIDAAKAAIRNLDAQIVLQDALIAQARAAVESSQATLTFADADSERYRELLMTGSGTVQRAQQTESIRGQASAQLQRDRAGLLAAQKKIAVLHTEREQALAQLERAQAQERQAQLNLSYTVITSPVDGNIGARTLRVGQFVAAGTQLMAVVPLHASYVVANFKETQLTFVRDGQPVRIRVDGFPHVKLTGHVDSVSPASGLEFALLPPDNATGNFTKIVQRIPVKIALDPSPVTGQLRAGMSVEPTVDTKATVIAEQVTRQTDAQVIAARSASRSVAPRG